MTSFDDAAAEARRQYEQDEAERRHTLGPPVSGFLAAPGFGGMVAGSPPFRGLGSPPPEPTGPYTVWMDNGLGGWSPEDCDTLADCFHAMRAVAHGGDYRITRDVQVEIREARP